MVVAHVNPRTSREAVISTTLICTLSLRVMVVAPSLKCHVPDAGQTIPPWVVVKLDDVKESVNGA